MNELYEKVKEKLSIIENMYDIIRIIDPINKNILSIKNNENIVKNLRENAMIILIKVQYVAIAFQ